MACSPGRPATFPDAYPLHFIADCYCGEGPLRGDRDDSKCDMRCEDWASPYMCGGEDYLAVYKISEQVVEPPPPLPDIVAGADSIGCFDVKTNIGSFAEGVYTLDYMTNEVKHCALNDTFYVRTPFSCWHVFAEKLMRENASNVQASWRRTLWRVIPALFSLILNCIPASKVEVASLSRYDFVSVWLAFLAVVAYPLVFGLFIQYMLHGAYPPH